MRRFRRAAANRYRGGPFEEGLAKEIEAAGHTVRYEALKLPYVVPAATHQYTPDYVLDNGIVLEAKGWFLPEDRKKHLYVRETNPDLDLRFVFQRAKSPLYKGSPTSYADWCTKHGFLYADKHIPVSWLTEVTNPFRVAAVMRLLEQGAKR